MNLSVVIAIAGLGGVSVFVYLWAQARGSLEKYSLIISIEEEVEKLKGQSQKAQEEVTEIRADYADKRVILKHLEEQVAIYDDSLAFAEVGLYEPHFDFDDSEAFKSQIKEVRSRQKEMVAAKEATRCSINWQVEGSSAKGRTMINRQTKLTLRAFNNECEAAVANVRWNNVTAMEKRIHKAANAIAKINASMELELDDLYIALKVEELRLTHECRELLKVEKDKRAESARAEREEKRLLAESRLAEKEEQKYQTLLEEARKEATGDNTTDELAQKIRELEVALSEAHAKSERARAMAEVTSSGYVYVISNVGSFGENIVKIGLTRRLDPTDRVRELGDASVPFSFDTHAMIYSDEAPALESALHKEFADKRVNTANTRKEFFTASLDEVEEAVSRLAPAARFFRDREAQEWQETLARRNQRLKEAQTKPSDALPETI